jgi:hypothetical protein
MKRLKLVALGLVVGVFSACTGTQEESNPIKGEWKLVSFTEDGSTVELTDCDAQTVWDFTDQDGEPLSDGTKVQILTATAPEECKFYGFDAKWTVVDGQLFISTSRIGGMGGNSFAGLLKIVELNENRLTLEMKTRSLIFER